MTDMTPSEAERKGRKVGRKDLRLKYSSEKVQQGHQGIHCLPGMGLLNVHATLSWEQAMEACCWQEGVGGFQITAAGAMSQLRSLLLQIQGAHSHGCPRDHTC